MSALNTELETLRDGKAAKVPPANMAPDDMALLTDGDLIPCDGRVLEAKDFLVNQAPLTGEPFPVEKAPDDSRIERDIVAAGNVVPLGTSAIGGTAKVLMCRTGQTTRRAKLPTAC